MGKSNNNASLIAESSTLCHSPLCACGQCNECNSAAEVTPFIVHLVASLELDSTHRPWISLSIHAYTHKHTHTHTHGCIIHQHAWQHAPRIHYRATHYTFNKMISGVWCHFRNLCKARLYLPLWDSSERPLAANFPAKMSLLLIILRFIPHASHGMGHG